MSSFGPPVFRLQHGDANMPHLPMGDLPSCAEPELQPTPSHLRGGCLQQICRKSARKKVKGGLLCVVVELESSRALVTVAKKWVDVAAMPLFPYLAPYDKALRVGLSLRLGFGLRLRDVLTRVIVTENDLTLDGQRVGCTSTTTATTSASPTSGSAAAQ
jgi:hypothetical protein